MPARKPSPGQKVKAAKKSGGRPGNHEEAAGPLAALPSQTSGRGIVRGVVRGVVQPVVHGVVGGVSAMGVAVGRPDLQAGGVLAASSVLRAEAIVVPGGPQLRDGWQDGRDAVSARVVEARTAYDAATNLLNALSHSALRPGDNEGPLRAAALEAVTVLLRPVGTTLDVLQAEMSASTPNPLIVKQNGETLELAGWAGK